MNERNQSNDLHILSHTKWNCKYHVVFAPKYRRAVFYDSKDVYKRQALGINLVSATVIAGMFALINYRIKMLAINKPAAASETDDDDEEDI